MLSWKVKNIYYIIKGLCPGIAVIGIYALFHFDTGVEINAYLNNAVIMALIQLLTVPLLSVIPLMMSRLRNLFIVGILYDLFLLSMIYIIDIVCVILFTFIYGNYVSLTINISFQIEQLLFIIVMPLISAVPLGHFFNKIALNGRARFINYLHAFIINTYYVFFVFYLSSRDITFSGSWFIGITALVYYYMFFGRHYTEIEIQKMNIEMESDEETLILEPVPISEWKKYKEK